MRCLFAIPLLLLLVACSDDDSKANLNVNRIVVEAQTAPQEQEEQAKDASFTRSLLRQNATMFQTNKDEE